MFLKSETIFNGCLLVCSGIVKKYSLVAIFSKDHASEHEVHVNHCKNAHFCVLEQKQTTVFMCVVNVFKRR